MHFKTINKTGKRTFCSLSTRTCLTPALSNPRFSNSARKSTTRKSLSFLFSDSDISCDSNTCTRIAKTIWFSTKQIHNRRRCVHIRFNRRRPTLSVVRILSWLGLSCDMQPTDDARLFYCLVLSNTKSTAVNTF